jgi:hypothetical protein
MAPEVGLEPTTLRLTAECSAIELLRSVLKREILTRCASLVITNTDIGVKDEAADDCSMAKAQVDLVVILRRGLRNSTNFTFEVTFGTCAQWLRPVRC